jgi:twitching motility protein PilI
MAAVAVQPFEPLKTLEARSRQVASSRGRTTGGRDEWIGVGFRLAGERLIAARDEVREVLRFPAVTCLPGAKDWLLGLANVRGQLLPIIDLKAFGGAGAISVSSGTRVLAINHAEIPAGLVVDEVRGLRRFGSQADRVATLERLPSLSPYLAGSRRSEQETWSVLNLTALVESPLFLRAARTAR